MARLPARIFSGAPAASWIAPPGVPGDAFAVFHARRTLELPSRPARFVVSRTAHDVFDARDAFGDMTEENVFNAVYQLTLALENDNRDEVQAASALLDKRA